jgi:hypothetical protein
MPDAAAHESDDVKPVYPDAPANPLATKLCDALHGTEERHRRACCNTAAGGASAATGVASECARNVSAAMKLGTIELADADVDACAAAMERTFAGCDWVGPLSPQVAHECQGIVHGRLGASAVCRSTLECGSGLVCHGVGPTSVGRCGAPQGVGQRCTASADVLVTYARQDATDELKPACVTTAVCLRGLCAPRMKIGDVCQSSEQCESGGYCRDDKCTKTSAKAGEACGASAPCEAGLVCQSSGRCGPLRKAAGAACASDLECVGGCIKAAGAKRGTCGTRC